MINILRDLKIYFKKELKIISTNFIKIKCKFRTHFFRQKDYLFYLYI